LRKAIATGLAHPNDSTERCKGEDLFRRIHRSGEERVVFIERCHLKIYFAFAFDADIHESDKREYRYGRNK
jgi:hypothetical protein